MYLHIYESQIRTPLQAYTFILESLFKIRTEIRMLFHVFGKKMRPPKRKKRLRGRKSVFSFRKIIEYYKIMERQIEPIATQYVLFAHYAICRLSFIILCISLYLRLYSFRSRTPLYWLIHSRLRSKQSLNTSHIFVPE